MFISSLIVICAVWGPAPQDVPPYFVKLIQERTLYANDEPVWLVIRLGNQLGKTLKSKRFPDILKSLSLNLDGATLEMSDKFSSSAFYKKVKSLKYGAHREFRFNLRKYFPGMKGGSVYQIHYADANYNIKGKPISIADVAMPDLNAEYLLDTSMGLVTIKLEPEQAPNHSRNFAILTAMQFYRDMIFHRVVPGFVIQTGDPLGTGQGGSGFSLKVEKTPFLRHTKYAVGMARAEALDTATSQFYICLERVKELDEAYTVFGRVIEGFDVIDAIGKVQTNTIGGVANKPVIEVLLKSVSIKAP